MCKIVRESSNASCRLDPVPTWLVKSCLDVLAPSITEMVNLSLFSGCVPENWRTTVVIPLLKRPGLDLVYKNFRPVSNLPFISKVVEKAALQQLLVHCEKNAPLPKYQSDFRKYHSTETALLKAQNDILMSMDNKEVTLLVLLDLSAAFDTIEHSILLNILQQDFGVAGTALNWFDSFLSGRKQRILVGDMTSDDFSLNCGVPQGSCMGPVLFTLYVSRHFNFISQHLPSVHGYADDPKIYLSFRPCSIHSEINAVSVIEKCIADVRSWFIGNRLMINDAKTDFLIAKFDLITPALIDLHWLPVTLRVQFKFLIPVYKSLHNQSPSYITDLLSVKPAANYTLRSSAKSLLLVPKVNCSTLGDRAFAHAAPALWNSQPLTIRSSGSPAICKKQLKTFLFKKAFNLLE